MKIHIWQLVVLIMTFQATRHHSPLPTVKLPNQVEIDTNLHCDRTEVTNIAWREYMFWNLKIFGQASERYKSTIPDTACWNEIVKSLEGVGDKYLYSAKFDHHPVVGVSQAQAKAYSNWRSDRVFENYLLTEFNYSVDTTQSSDTYFSIERFLSNSLVKFPFNDDVKYYPQFTLPDDQQRMKMIAFAESKKCQPADHVDGMSTKKIKKNGFVTKRCAAKRNSKKLYDLYGNVAEWSNNMTVAYGCSWRCQTQQTQDDDSHIELKQNAWTGFRNIASWKKIKS